MFRALYNLLYVYGSRSESGVALFPRGKLVLRAYFYFNSIITHGSKSEIAKSFFTIDS